MSDSTASLQRKISSAGDLQSVVRSMKALAASSIGQYEKSVLSLADYYRTIELGLGACLRKRPATWAPPDKHCEHPIGAVVFGSDQGLVGQFNEVIADFAVAKLAPLAGERRVWAIGDRVHDRLADAGLPPVDVLAMPSSVRGITSLVGQIQLGLEAARSLDESSNVFVFYNRHQAAALPEPVCLRLLPLDAEWERALIKLPWPTRNPREVMGEGDAMMRALVREYVFISLFRACAESLASENASRLAAMERADRNIDELLGDFQSAFHRIRQGSIDEELFDVISGFEALTKMKP